MSASSPVRVTVLLADDSAMIREAIRRMLAEHFGEIDVIAEAKDFSETVALTRKLKPQVVVMDLYMPKRTSDLDINRAHKDISARLVTMSIAQDDEAAELARSYGADVLLDKMDLYNTLVPTIVGLAFPNAASA